MVYISDQYARIRAAEDARIREGLPVGTDSKWPRKAPLSLCVARWIPLVPWRRATVAHRSMHPRSCVTTTREGLSVRDYQYISFIYIS